MSHFVVTAFGTLGDTLPYVAVGAELRRRGHEVALVASPALERQAREASLELVPVGTQQEYRAFVQDPGLWERSTVVKSLVTHWIRGAQESYEAVVRAHRHGESILLASPLNQAARLAQERLALPFVSGIVSPSRMGSRLDPPHPSRPFPAWTDWFVRTPWGLRALQRLRLARRHQPASASLQAALDEARRLRRLAGLPDTPPPDAWRSDVIVCLWPSWFAPRQADWPPDAKTSGFPFQPVPQGADPARAATDERERAIVFIRGSVTSHQLPFFTAAVECCRVLARPGVLVTPHAENVPAPLPAGVRHVSFASFAELFREASAVVHHGGIGTIAHALLAGVPQLVLPIVGEQFDLGYRVERLGVGLMRTREPVRAGWLSRDVEALLASSRVRRRCERVRAQVEPAAGCALAADWIEQWLAGRRRARA